MLWENFIEVIRQHVTTFGWKASSSALVQKCKEVEEEGIVIHRMDPSAIEGDFSFDFAQQAKADGLFRILKKTFAELQIKIKKYLGHRFIPLFISKEENAPLLDDPDFIEKLKKLLEQPPPIKKWDLGFIPERKENFLHPEYWPLAKQYFQDHPSNNIYFLEFYLFFNINQTLYASPRLVENHFSRKEITLWEVIDEQGRLFIVKAKIHPTVESNIGILHLTRKLGFTLGAFQQSFPKGLTKTYMLHPYLPQEDLLTYLSREDRNKTLNNFTLLKIMLGCSEAIYSLHRRRIVHGDIKPDNFRIAFTEHDMLITLLDLEFSVKIPKGLDYITKEHREGTRKYIPPELLSYHQYSFVSDIYSFGQSLSSILKSISCFTPWKEWDMLIEEMICPNPSSRICCTRLFVKLILLATKKQCLSNENEKILINNFTAEKKPLFNQNTWLSLYPHAFNTYFIFNTSFKRAIIENNLSFLKQESTRVKESLDFTFNDPNLSSMDTLLHLAAHLGRTEIVALLIELGDNPSKTNAYCFSPLHLAVINGHTETVKYLLSQEASPHLWTGEGMMPIHYAAAYNHPDILCLLLEKEPFLITVANVKGDTALRLAQRQGFQEVVRVLLAFGAGRNVRDNVTPWQIEDKETTKKLSAISLSI